MIMSHSASLASARPAINYYWYAQVLARFVQQRRFEVGLSLEEAAELSGLQVSQWAALESGWVPTEDAMFRAIGDTLAVAWPNLAIYAMAAESAQEALSR